MRFAVFVLAASTAVLSGCGRYVEIGSNGSHVADPIPNDANADPTDLGVGSDGGGALSGDGGAPDGARSDAESDAPPPTILWSTSVENGDVSDWSQNGPAVGGVFQHLVELSVSEGRAHSGSHAVKIGFDSTDGQDHMSELYRRTEAQPAYYGAWFFIEEAHVPKTYWTLFYFFYQLEAGNTTTRRGLWDVNLNRTTVYFYDEHTLHFVDAVPQKPFPIGQWVHLEAYFAYEAPRSGHIKVWLDGDVVLDVKDLGTAPSDNLYWGIGSDTNGLTPPGCTMYIDDATISTERLGP